jgi:adenine-specific DNA-methyltransferase
MTLSPEVSEVLSGSRPWWVEQASVPEFLPLLPDACVSLIVADPPYFRVKDEWWDRQWDSPAKFLAWLAGIAGQWRRVLKPNGSLYCFASPQMAARVEVMLGERFNVLSNVRWRKDDGWAKRQCKEEQRLFFPASEAVIFCEQSGADCVAMDAAGYEEKCDSLHKQVYGPIGSRIRRIREAAGLSMKDVAECFPSRTGGITGCVSNWETGNNMPSLEQYVTICRRCGDRREYEDLRREYEDLRRPFTVTADVPTTDVWDYATVNDYPGKHVCEKPEAMLAHIIAASSRPGDVVLDCFSGSGVAGRAAKLLGRRYLGVEIQGQWVTAARQRIGDYFALFAGQETA